MAAFPVPQRDRLLLLLLSEAVGGHLDKWVSRTNLSLAIRAAEQQLPVNARLYFVRDAEESSKLDSDLGLLEHLGFIDLQNGSLRLTALGDSGCAPYELPNKWKSVLPLVQQQLLALTPESHP